MRKTYSIETLRAESNSAALKVVVNSAFLKCKPLTKHQKLLKANKPNSPTLSSNLTWQTGVMKEDLYVLKQGETVYFKTHYESSTMGRIYIVYDGVGSWMFPSEQYAGPNLKGIIKHQTALDLSTKKQIQADLQSKFFI